MTLTGALLEVKDLGTQIPDAKGIYIQQLTGKFIFISFSVENVGTDSRTLYDLRVIDDQGRIYNICNQAYGYLTGSVYSACTLVDILTKGKAPELFSYL